MALWGFKWLKFFLNPFGDDDFEHISEDDRRAYIVHRLETAKLKEYSWVVVVAGVGFFTDAYSIFAINMVIPILGIVYYGGTMPHNYETALSVVTLGGSIIGQIGFGFGADIWGRRKMYGLELIVTIVATLGVVMASNGTAGSMSVIVWLLVWRFVLGIGIGADYPLSAVICSEFAPTRMRGKMLTLVFACQPLGQLAATLVALIASVRQRSGIPGDATITKCNEECKRTLDSIWRWIIGVGVIPAVIALWFRLTIIESPRYTADVGGDTAKAASELKRYLLGSQQIGLVSSTSIDTHNRSAYRRPLRRRSTSSGARSGPVNHTGLDNQQHETQPLSRRSSGALSVNPSPEEANTEQHETHPLTRNSSGAISIESGARTDNGDENHDLRTEQHNLMPVDLHEAEGSSTVSPLHGGFDSRQAGTDFNLNDGSYEPQNVARAPYQDDPEANIDFHTNRLTQNPSKQYFMTSTGKAFPITPSNGNVANSDDNKQPPPPNWEDFKDYFWHKGNLRTLIATSVCWFCVDLPFYGLGMNSPHIITVIWYGKNPQPQTVYDLLVHNVWQSLVVVSIGAIVGISITFVAIDRLGRKWIQMIGFFWLFILFIVIGGSFYHLYDIGGQAAIVVLYILCQIFFNFGPNATTYIMPAELFPTRYRALCHGISAASGKLGSVIAQVFLAYINYGHGDNYNDIPKWLPYSLLIFSIFMLIGLYTTIVWIPGQEHSPSGAVKTLEQWQKGRVPEKDYSHTRWGKVVVSVWRWIGSVGGYIFMVLDSLSGGEEKERRSGKVVVDGERELDEVDDERGRSGADGERARPFVNGSVRHASR
ncbi:MFS general substrate transporter [Mollisia scopiformis]|uniref:MFS general substrate transporter n=1 Tax=Mollisia scopiformis TaxID=149040 RepID=A0A194XVD2_MOLSC|nr:MFS general substrate transporter [Mollisia scopiformis]KUJ23969.1 MFS general substrate transporter [Mollisia scopiformis]